MLTKFSFSIFRSPLRLFIIPSQGLDGELLPEDCPDGLDEELLPEDCPDAREEFTLESVGA